MSSNRGRRGKRWMRLKAEVRLRRERCCRCGQDIDYQLDWPDPQSFSVDHYPYAWATYPELREDPANLRAAHLLCNQTAGAAAPAPSIGEASEKW